MEKYLPHAGETMTVAGQPPAIEMAMRQLEKHHDHLIELAIVLEERLTSVMREPEPDAAEPKRLNQPAGQAPLTVQLTQRVREAEALIDRLGRLVRRLEV